MKEAAAIKLTTDYLSKSIYTKWKYTKIQKETAFQEPILDIIYFLIHAIQAHQSTASPIQKQ